MAQSPPEYVFLNEISDQHWVEVRTIINAQPQLINSVIGDTLLNTAGLQGAPEDIMVDMVDAATEETIDTLDQPFNGSILHTLTRNGQTQAVRRVLEKSHNHVNHRDKYGNTPLHILLTSSHTLHVHCEITEGLLEAGANVYTENKDGFTPIVLYGQNLCSEYDAAHREQHKAELLALFTQ